MALPTRTPATSLGPAEIKAAVSINPNAIQEEYVQLPATLHRWIQARVDAAEAHRLAELDETVMEEKLRIDVRALNDEALASKAADIGKVKKLTVDEANALVVTDARYRAVHEKTIATAKAKETADGMVEAIKTKRDMLISLGATLRAEHEIEMMIKDRTGGRR